MVVWGVPCDIDTTGDLAVVRDSSGKLLGRHSPAMADKVGKVGLGDSGHYS
jgi:hypothetical protein